MSRNWMRECKIKMEMLWFLILIWVIVSCDAFAPVVHRLTTLGLRASEVKSKAAAVSNNGNTAKTIFLDALDRPYDLNAHSETRTNLLNALIDSRAGLSNPGSAETFASVAPGIWRVVYAPHMTIIASLVRGELSVQVSGHIIRLSY